MIDAFAAASINTNTLDEAFQLIEVMASNDYRAPLERILPKKGMMELDSINTLLAQREYIVNTLAKLLMEG